MSDIFSKTACNNFSFFRKYVLKRKNALMYDRIIEAIEADDTENLCVIASRGHGKSTLVSIDYPLWKCLNNEGKPLTITISSSNLDMSRLLIEEIQRTIEDNNFLHDNLKPSIEHDVKWNAQRITTANKDRIFCIPFGSTARGKHCHLSILDDVLKREISNVEYAKTTFWSDVFPITKAKRGKHLVIGTPMYFNDLLSELKQNNLFKTMEFPAVIADNRGEWLMPQCPEMFSLDDLRRMKENIPSFSWSAEYMLVPMSDGSLLFPSEIVIPCVRKEQLSTPISAVYYGSLDPAISAEGDFSVFTIGRKTEKGYEVLFSESHKGLSSQSQIKRIIELDKEFKFQKFVVEDNGLGKGLVADAMESDIKSILIPFTTSKGEKERIFGQLELLLRKKEISLPDDPELIKEMTTIGLKKSRNGSFTMEALSGHDDRVMSLALLSEAMISRGVTSIAFF